MEDKRPEHSSEIILAASGLVNSTSNLIHVFYRPPTEWQRWCFQSCVCSWSGGETITQDALDPVIQGPLPGTCSDSFNLDLTIHHSCNPGSMPGPHVRFAGFPLDLGNLEKWGCHLENLDKSWNFEQFNKYHGKIIYNLEKLGGC